MRQRFHILPRHQLPDRVHGQDRRSDIHNGYRQKSRRNISQSASSGKIRTVGKLLPGNPFRIADLLHNANGAAVCGIGLRAGFLDAESAARQLCRAFFLLGRESY